MDLIAYWKRHKLDFIYGGKEQWHKSSNDMVVPSAIARNKNNDGSLEYSSKVKFPHPVSKELSDEIENFAFDVIKLNDSMQNKQGVVLSIGHDFIKKEVK